MAQALKVLQVSQAIYFHPLREYVLKHYTRDAKEHFGSFADQFHAAVSNSLVRGDYAKHLGLFLKEQGSLALGLTHEEAEDDMTLDVQYIASSARSRTRDTLISVDEVGLGGAHAQRIFAETMNELMTAHVQEAYAGQVTDLVRGPDSLMAWIDEFWWPFVAEVVACLHGDDENPESVKRITQSDVSNWKERAVHELATLRLREAFDIVVDWQNSSNPGLADIATLITTMSGRAYVTNHFSMAVSNRLLQPGASTVEILQIYIHVIMAFLDLDPKGVLLDRVSRPIRRYLRDRDDTVRIIIQGLLIDTSAETEATPEPLFELAKVMNELSETSKGGDSDAEMYDLNWTPDPVDAAPEYKRGESGEIIGSLIDIFDNKDVFVKEFQNMLSESLLKGGTDFIREGHVLGLFKERLGDGLLQACDVMLRDLTESLRTDAYIKKESKLDQTDTVFTTKILSRLYWPPLQSEDYAPPTDVKLFQDNYEKAFEHYKPSRKLQWLHSLGQARVELELEDRSLEIDCHTWQAEVIYQFHQEDEHDGKTTKSFEDVVTETDMDEDLVQAALTFWVGKMVLHEPSLGEYTVLEKLPPTSGGSTESSANTGSAALNAAAAAASASAAATESASSAVKSDADILQERMGVFWQYIVGMLTNQGQMPLQRIVMMLRFVVPGGFAFGNEELRSFLASKVAEGKLELAGGNYKIVRSAN